MPESGSARWEPRPAAPRRRTIVFGSGAFALPILDALIDAPEVDVVGVISAPDRPVGRGGALGPAPVAQRARTLGLQLFQPSSLRDPVAIAQIADLDPELGVLADYGRIVPQAILDLPGHGILNIHPSLLPRHRGAAPIQAAILAGDRDTGVTIIRMDAGLDTGPIVAAERLPLSGAEATPELEARAAATGAALLRRSLPGWLAGTLPERAQGDEGATVTRPLRREDGRLDPARTGPELERQVRAYQPWPGAFVDTVVGPIKVWRAGVVRGAPADGEVSPGSFVAGDGLRLRTADGYLVLLEVQPSGGRRMSGAELVRGRPHLLGSRVAAAAATSLQS